MHTSWRWLGIVLVFLVACGEDALQKGSGAGGLSKLEYDQLLALNRLQQDNVEARDFVHHDIVSLMSEKSKAMAEKIAYPACVVTGQIPDNDLTGAIHEQTIAGDNCPIYWFRRRGWTLGEKIMIYSDKLMVLSDSYRKQYTPMSVRSLSGQYKVIPDSGGFRVVGTITINEFQTVSLGRVMGNITIEHQNRNQSGGGMVTLNLTTSHGLKKSASISWTLRRGGLQNVVYRIGSSRVEESAFNELFSSFEMDKIMANVLIMK